MSKCLTCAVDLLRRAGRGRPRMFCESCSPHNKNECNRAWRARNRDKYNLARRQDYGASGRAKYLAVRDVLAARHLETHPPKSRVCAWCGETFISRRAKKLCGDACRWLWSRAKRSDRPKVLALPTRLRILERDGWRCYLCGEAIPQSRHWPDPQFGSVDHVIPRSKSGSDTEGNLRASHLRCNRLKSDALLEAVR